MGRRIKCDHCRKSGHDVRDCPTVICSMCNEEGHLAKYCPMARWSPSTSTHLSPSSEGHPLQQTHSSRRHLSQKSPSSPRRRSTRRRSPSKRHHSQQSSPLPLIQPEVPVRPSPSQPSAFAPPIVYPSQPWHQPSQFPPPTGHSHPSQPWPQPSQFPPPTGHSHPSQPWQQSSQFPPPTGHSHSFQPRQQPSQFPSPTGQLSQPSHGQLSQPSSGQLSQPSNFASPTGQVSHFARPTGHPPQDQQISHLTLQNEIKARLFQRHPAIEEYISKVAGRSPLEASGLTSFLMVIMNTFLLQPAHLSDDVMKQAEFAVELWKNQSLSLDWMLNRWTEVKEKKSREETIMSLQEKLLKLSSDYQSCVAEINELRKAQTTLKLDDILG